MSDKFVFHNPLYEERSNGTIVKLINGATASATSSTGTPSVSVTVDGDGIADFSFELPIGPTGATGATGATGPTGEGFSIYNTYASITAMNAAATGVPTGKFVLITSTPEDEDNSKLFVKASDGTFTFINDLSGAQGIQGPIGPTGIQGPTGPTGITGPTGPTGVNSNLGVGNYVLTCSTTASTVAKTITCSDFVLTAGAYVTVTFTAGNSASNATLNINSTGAYNIKYFSSGATLSNVPAYFIKANETVDLRFDGTEWIMLDGCDYGDLDASYTNL